MFDKMMRKLFCAIAPLCVLMTGAHSLQGATRVTTSTGGDWNSTTTWSGGVVPGSADTAIILAGASLTVSANVQLKSVIFSNNSPSTAVLTVNSGFSLNVNGAITLKNSATTNTSVLFQGAGTIFCDSLTVGGTTTPTPPASSYSATLTSTISNLTVYVDINVNALYNSLQSAANQGVFAIGSGSVNADWVTLGTVPLFGPTLTLITGDQNATLTLSDSQPIRTTGGGSYTFTPAGSNATVVYSGKDQLIRSGTYQHVTFSTSGTSGIKTNAGLVVNGVLTRQGPVTLTAAPTYGSNATLEYKGPGAHVSGPELTATVPNLTINNVDGVTLTNNVTLTGLLKLTSGKVNTGSNRIKMSANASVSGAGSSSYVQGKVQKTFNTGTQVFAFPIGDATSYTPVTLSNLSVVASGDITASTTSGNHPQIATSGIDTARNVNRYWTLTQSNGSFGTFQASFNYPAADVDAGANAAQFFVNCWTSGAWSPASISGTPTTTSTSITAQNQLGDFVIGDLSIDVPKLVITSINSGASPQVGTDFSVVIQAQNSAGVPTNVTANTGVALSLHTGNGTLSGTLTGTISNGMNSVTLAGVGYNKAESGVILTASRTSGMTLMAGNSSAFTVNPGNQTISFSSPGNQTYGVAPIALTATASSGLPVAYSVTAGPGSVSNNILTITGAGSLTVQAAQSGNSDWNAATPVSHTISIAQKTVTASINANNKIYDGTNTASIASRSLSGVINGDDVSAAAGVAAFADKNVGTGKTVTETGLGLTGAKAGNYILSSTSAQTTANITAASLTVRADDKTRPYGTTNPVLTASCIGFVGGEGVAVLSGSPSLSTTAVSDSPIGTYPIQISQGTLASSNYSFSFTNGTLTVTENPTLVSIKVIVGPPNQVFLHYAGMTPGETYHIHASSDLHQWTDIDTAQADGSGEVIYNGTNALSACYYRLAE